MRNKNILWFFPALMILLSCGKQITGSSTKYLNIENYKIDEITFDYFSLKSKISLVEQGNNQKATALIRIRKDSLIWFNLSGSLGIQGMRGVLTKDSIKVLDRLNKEFYQYTYENLSERFNFELNYDLLEAMILGNLPYHTNLSDSVELINNYYVLKQKDGNLSIINYVNPGNRKVIKVNLVQQLNQNKLTLEYSNFEFVETRVFPFYCNILLIYNRDEGKMERGLNIDHVKVEFPKKPLKFPFNIPNKYEKE